MDFKLNILGSNNYFVEKNGNWEFIITLNCNELGGSHLVKDENVISILDEYKECSNRDIDTIDLNLTQDPDIKQINNWIKALKPLK